jgi:crossover junction endodeoxyribonuclease RuvC
LRVLGIDPGSCSTGWGLLGGSSSAPRLLECGVIRLGKRGAFADRLSCLQREITDLVERLRPNEAAVEAPFHGASARSALQLAHARGVVLAVLAGAGLSVAEYSPAAVKKAITGSGRADKRQVRKMVEALLNRPTGSSSHDVSDALAVSMCHLAGHAFRSAVARQEVGREPARRPR